MHSEKDLQNDYLDVTKHWMESEEKRSHLKYYSFFSSSKSSDMNNCYREITEVIISL